MGTTRVIANSLGLFDIELPMLESQQFVLPMLSVGATADPRREPDFTLNQFNMIVALNGSSVDISQLHFYTFNPAFINALPAATSKPLGGASSGTTATSTDCRPWVPAVVEVTSAPCSSAARSQRLAPSRLVTSPETRHLLAAIGCFVQC